MKKTRQIISAVMSTVITATSLLTGTVPITASAEASSDSIVLYDNFETYGEAGTAVTLSNSNWEQLDNTAIVVANDPKDASNHVGKITKTCTSRKTASFNDPLIVSGKFMLLSDSSSMSIGMRSTGNAGFFSFSQNGNRISLVNQRSSSQWIANEWINFVYAVHANADPTQCDMYAYVWGDGVTAPSSMSAVGDLSQFNYDGSLIKFDSSADVLIDDIKIYNSKALEISMDSVTNVTSPFTLKFNHPVDSSTLVPSELTLTKTDDNTVIPISNISVSENLESAVITPASPLENNSIYKLELSTSVFDIAHNRAATNIYFSTDDTVPPTPDDMPVLVEGIRLQPEEINTFVGYTEDFQGMHTYDDDKLCVPRMDVLPNTANNQTLKWVSENPSIASIDEQSGNITPVSEGTTYIYAQATDGSETKSNKVLVNVGPKRDNENQKLCLSDTETPRIDKEAHLSCPQNIGDPQVALWKNNATGAFTLTVDDGISGDFDTWNSYVDKYGFHATFFIPGTTLENSNFRQHVDKLTAYNQDVESHTYSHSSDQVQGTYESGIWFEDFGRVPQILKDTYDLKCKTLGYSYGTAGSTPGQADNADYMRMYYIAARGVTGDINEADTLDYNYISSLSLNGSVRANYTPGAFSSMEGLIKSLYDTNYTFKNSSHIGGWACVHSHGLSATGWATDENGQQIPATNPDLGYATTTDELLTYTFDNFLKPASDSGKVWVDTFTNVAMYAQSRDTAIINVTENTDESIKFTLTDKMDDTVFDYPLTIKFKVNNDWEKIGAVQDGKSLEVKEVSIDGSKYIMVNAVPDAGLVTVTPFSSDVEPTPSTEPSASPTVAPTASPTVAPTSAPTATPVPTTAPSGDVIADNIFINDPTDDYINEDGSSAIGKFLPIADKTNISAGVTPVRWTGGSSLDTDILGVSIVENPKEENDLVSHMWSKKLSSDIHQLIYSKKLPNPDDTVEFKGSAMIPDTSTSALTVWLRTGSTRDSIMVTSGNTLRIFNNNAAKFTVGEWFNFDIVYTPSTGDISAYFYGDGIQTTSGQSAPRGVYYLGKSPNSSHVDTSQTIAFAYVLNYGYKKDSSSGTTVVVPDSQGYSGQVYIDNTEILVPGDLTMSITDTGSVSPDTTILPIFFNHNINITSSITTESLGVYNSDGEKINVQTYLNSENPKSLNLVFAQGALTNGETYTIKATDSVKDVNGSIPANEITFTVSDESTVPTVSPTAAPTAAPTASPTAAPTASPTVAPTTAPTASPTAAPEVQDNILLNDTFDDYKNEDGTPATGKPLPINDKASSISPGVSPIKWSSGGRSESELENGTISIVKNPSAAAESNDLAAHFWSKIGTGSNMQLVYSKKLDNPDGSVEFKGSIMIPDTNTSGFTLWLRNDKIDKIFNLTKTNINLCGKTVGRFTAGQWFNFDIVYTPSTGEAFAYLYGDGLRDTSSTPQDGIYVSSTMSSVGINLTKAISFAYVLDYKTTPDEEGYYGQMYLDNIEILVPGSLTMSVQNADELEATDTITVDFSHNIRPDLISSESFTIKGGNNEKTIKSVEINAKEPNKAIITLDSALDYGTEYTITANNSVMDLSGNTPNATKVYTKPEKIEDYEISSVVFTQNGETVNNYSSGLLTASITAKANVSEDTPVMLIAAQYADGNLVKLSIQNEVLESGLTKELSVPIEIDFAENSTVRVMLLKSNSLFPLTKTSSIFSK